jgi:hypothetical protein
MGSSGLRADVSMILVFAEGFISFFHPVFFP